MSDLNDVITNAVADCAAIKLNDGDKLPRNLLSIPEGVGFKDIEALLDAPVSQKQDTTFLDEKSFLSYFNEHTSDDSRLYYTKSSEGEIAIECVFDSHTAGQPSHERHKASLLMPFHPDYKDLRSMSARSFGQTEFAEWCEEVLHLFVKPDAATILEIGQELKGSRRAEFKAGKRLSNGQTTLEYSEELTAQTRKGDIEVPDRLMFSCPIFEGGEAQAIPAAFRWRIDEEGKITFHYKLMTKVEEREAQQKILESINKATGRDALFVQSF